MMWFDCKKIFHSVPHNWIISVLHLAKVTQKIIDTIQKSHEIMVNYSPSDIRENYYWNQKYNTWSFINWAFYCLKCSFEFIISNFEWRFISSQRLSLNKMLSSVFKASAVIELRILSKGDVWSAIISFFLAVLGTYFIRQKFSYISLTVFLIMSRTRFRVHPHSIVAWKSRNTLLETGAKSEV